MAKRKPIFFHGGGWRGKGGVVNKAGGRQWAVRNASPQPFFTQGAPFFLSSSCSFPHFISIRPFLYTVVGLCRRGLAPGSKSLLTSYITVREWEKSKYKEGEGESGMNMAFSILPRAGLRPDGNLYRKTPFFSGLPFPPAACISVPSQTEG